MSVSPDCTRFARGTRRTGGHQGRLRRLTSFVGESEVTESGVWSLDGKGVGSCRIDDGRVDQVLVREDGDGSSPVPTRVERGRGVRRTGEEGEEVR